jgi:3-hydroxyisobutyrate dehydrogenase-like beta-hydroxyacid dehydrogenase
MRVAVLGLGEAGGRLASDLVAAGLSVSGWDPAEPAGLPEVLRATSGREALRGADVILSVNSASVALEVAEDVGGELSAAQLYADLNTGLPALKAELERAVGASFVDVALLGAVPNRGLRTPALASGPGAERFAELLGPLGMPVEVVGPASGDAAGLKLVRSVFMKGLAASVVESLEAARACGAEDWLRDQILGVLESPGGPLLERLVSGTEAHAARRTDEMEAAADHLRELGVEPRVTLAAAAWLEEIASRAREGAR